MEADKKIIVVGYLGCMGFGHASTYTLVEAVEEVLRVEAMEISRTFDIGFDYLECLFPKIEPVSHRIYKPKLKNRLMCNRSRMRNLKKNKIC